MADGSAGLGDEPLAEAAKEATEDIDALPKFDLMIVIPSRALMDRERRLAVRETWAQYLNASAVNCTSCVSRTAKILFVVGKEDQEQNITEEAGQFGDLAELDDFKEPTSPAGATEMVQRSIRYALEHFRFNLLLKVDQSNWVFMDRLLEFLEEKHLFDINATLPGVYAGNFASKDHASSNNESLSLKAFTGSMAIPLYAKGGAYLLSPDLCEFIAGMGAASEDTSGAPKWGEDYGWAPVPRLVDLPNEDLSVGFWLQAVNHTKVEATIVGDDAGCSEERPLIDRVTGAAEMQKRWRSFVRQGSVCERSSPQLLQRGPENKAGFLQATTAPLP